MGLIHTCELNGGNPFHYLTGLQRQFWGVAAKPIGVDALGTMAKRLAGLARPRPPDIMINPGRKGWLAAAGNVTRKWLNNEFLPIALPSS